MMTHKSKIKTANGEITTWLVFDAGCLPFRVIAYKMDEDYAKKNNAGYQTYDLNVEAFDTDSFEWKKLIKSCDFSDEEVKSILEGENILGEIRDLLRSLFGIRMYTDEK